MADNFKISDCKQDEISVDCAGLYNRSFIALEHFWLWDWLNLFMAACLCVSKVSELHSALRRELVWHVVYPLCRLWYEVGWINRKLCYSYWSACVVCGGGVVCGRECVWVNESAGWASLLKQSVKERIGRMLSLLSELLYIDFGMIWNELSAKCAILSICF